MKFLLSFEQPHNEALSFKNGQEFDLRPWIVALGSVFPRTLDYSRLTHQLPFKVHIFAARGHGFAK